MWMKIILLCALHNFAHSHILCQNATDLLVVIDDIGGNQFGYPLHMPVELSLIVKTPENRTTLPLGRWTIGFTTTLYSGYGTEEMYAESPRELAQNCYQFKLKIREITFNLMYKNNITFRVIVRNEGGNIIEARHTFQIPYVCSIDDLQIMSMLCVMLLAVAVILKMIALIYGICTFTFEISVWILLLVRLVCLLTTIGLLFGLVLPEMHIGYTLAILAVIVVIFYGDALLSFQLNVIYVYETCSKVITSMMLLYLTIVVLLKLIPYFNNDVRTCITMKIQQSIKEGMDIEKRRLTNLVEATKRIKNDQPSVATEDRFPGDEEVRSYLEVLGGDADQSYSPKQLKELGKRYKGKRREACLDFVQKTKDFCGSAKMTISGNCRKEVISYYKEETNWAQKLIVSNDVVHLAKQCGKTGEAITCKEIDTEICEQGKDSNGGLLKNLGKSFEKINLKPSGFEDLKLDVDSFKDMKMSMPQLPKSIIEILEFMKKYMFIISIMLGFYLFWGSYYENLRYINRYHKILTYDNFYIGRAFKIYDKKQVANGKRPLLPLTKEEIEKIKMYRLQTHKKRWSMKILVFVIVVWGLLYLLRNHVIARNSTLVAMKDTTVATQYHEFELKVIGSGKRPDEIRMAAEPLKSEGKSNITLDISSCIPEPFVIPHTAFAVVIFVLLLCLLEDRMQLVSMWRPFITGVYYPDAAEARLKFLYQKIRKERLIEKHHID